jgi:hypothetical protein
MSMHFWLAWIACFLAVVSGLTVACAIREYWLYRKGK